MSIYITAGRIEVEPLAVMRNGQLVLQLVNDRSQTCRRQFHELSADLGYSELIGTICQLYEAGQFFVEAEYKTLNHVTETAGEATRLGTEAPLETVWGLVTPACQDLGAS